MEKYRPEMKKYYYDPTKYKTYLDQLGHQVPDDRQAGRSRRRSSSRQVGSEARHEALHAR